MIFSLVLASAAALAVQSAIELPKPEQHRYERIAARSKHCSFDQNGGMTCFDKHERAVGYLPAQILVGADYSREKIIFYWQSK